MSVPVQPQRPPDSTTAVPPVTPAAQPTMTPGRFWAAVVVALVCNFLATLVVRHTELVTGRYLSGGVPPIPAFAALIVLVALRPLLRRIHPALEPDRSQLLLIFAMMCVAVVLGASYVVRAQLPHLITLGYWQGKHPALARFLEYFPEWYGPRDAQALREYYEGNQGRGVPWGLWLAPLLRWGFFFVAVFAACGCLMLVMRRQWLRNERLSFPLLYLPLALTAEGQGGIGPIFRHPLMWAGFACALVFNGFNIARAFHPAVPAPGFFYTFAGQFPDRPFTPLNTVMLFYMLEAIGIGYFLPLDVSFSAWFFYVVQKMVAVGGLSAGYDLPGFPYIQDQSAGAYVGVAVFLLYTSRRHLLQVFRRALGAGKDAESREERWACLGLLASVAFLLAWFWFAGWSLLVALPFFGIMFCFVLVYARLRAETGVPFEFVYPYGLPHGMLINAFSSRGVMDAGGLRTWVGISSMAWLSRHHFAQSMAAYSIDGLKLADEGRIPRRYLYMALLIAVVFGLGCAYWSHLSAYYTYGSNMAAGGLGNGEYRARVALQEFQRMANGAVTPPPRDDARLAAQGVGFSFALVLGIVRVRVAQFPFHPLGFILATSYGDHSTSFFPMFVAWFCKSTVLRLGGLPLYRQFIPFFLGLIIGHMLIGGVIWPALSLTLAPEARQSYHLFFGG